MPRYWPRAIAHCDMDAFFASVEIADFPELKGKPVIVGGDPGTRSVVCAASYEAKRFGVKTPMPSRQAAQLCPQAIFQRPRFRRYVEVSEQMIRIMRDFSPKVEVFSIDEVFVDITGSQRLFGTPYEICSQMKERVRKETGLTISIGCSPTRIGSKIASEIEKPDGLVVVPPESLRDFMDPLPAEKMLGIGEKTKIVLNSMGIYTLGDLARYSCSSMHKRLGKNGRSLWLLANGHDFSDIHTLFIPRSVTNSTTLDENTTDIDYLSGYLLLLSHCVGLRCRAKKIAGSCIILKLRWADMTSFSIRHKISFPTDNDDDIYYIALDILRDVTIEQPIRLIGVGVTNIEIACDPQLMTEVQKSHRLNSAIDQIEMKYGGGAITKAKLRMYNIHDSGTNPFLVFDDLKRDPLDEGD